MSRKPPIIVTDQAIINSIYDMHGDLRAAASKLKISYGTILNRMKHCPEAKRAKEDAVSEMIEAAENNIWQELLNGNFQASKFVLERLSREKWGNGNTNTVNEEPIPFAQAEDNDGE